MSYSASRLTLYAVLAAIEEDIRNVIRTHLSDHLSANDLLGNELWKKAAERLQKDLGMAYENPDLDDLLLYVDFGDSYQVVNQNRKGLPEKTSLYFRKITQDLERLVPIRNRVAHSRPLNFDDLAIALDIAEAFISTSEFIWENLKGTINRLRAEPSFVLGLRIPTSQADTSNQSHNLPIPDFDETGFLGRKQQAEDLIKLCLGPYPVITLVGDGGVGKTALALKVAYDILDLRNCPFEAVVWTSSKTTQLTSQEIVNIEGAICDSLGMFKSIADQLTGSSVAEPIDEVLTYLSEFRILLILDNLETVLDDRIKGFLERLPVGSKVLITSRIGLGAFEYPVRLRPMDEGDAVQLMRALSKIRGVEQLSTVNSKQLASFCRRMNNNPGYIKWFVSAVQAGKRPEEVLDQSGLFLDFCMSNVYQYLSAESRKVLRSMLSVPGRQSQAELAYLNAMDVLDLQKAVQQLLTTNMVNMTSIPRGSSFESQYDISELARNYLSKHHPVEPDEYKKFNKRRQQLITAGEQMKSEHRNNPFSFYSLTMRSRSDLIVAKYLHEALVASKGRNFEQAEAQVAKARGLAPEYFEVHRVDAVLKVAQGNIPAARISYEAAIELEPQSVPLRKWYGSFLLEYLGDSEGALNQFTKALLVDPLCIEIKLEIARTNLYLRNYEDAKLMIDSLVDCSDLTDTGYKKAYDLRFQYYQRRADDSLSAHSNGEALGFLEELRNAYLACPVQYLDGYMKRILLKAVRSARKCAYHLPPGDDRERASNVAAWLDDEGNKSEALSGWDGDNSDGRLSGIVARVISNKPFGFIRTDEGEEYFFARNVMKTIEHWQNISPGARVRFDLGSNSEGVCAVNVEVI